MPQLPIASTATVSAPQSTRTLPQNDGSYDSTAIEEFTHEEIDGTILEEMRISMKQSITQLRFGRKLFASPRASTNSTKTAASCQT